MLALGSVPLILPGGSDADPVSQYFGTASVGDVGGASPGNVNDGSEATTFTTTSTPTINQLIVKIDLGQAMTITSFRVVNALQAHANGISFKVQSSTDDISYASFGSSWTVNPGTTEQTQVQTPASPVTARYWALVAAQNFDAAVSVDEVQLFLASHNLP